jgi:hypothetical protein
MNKRIEELTEQATKYFPKTETSGEYWTFDKQKFAELIVKECVHWIDGSPSLEDGTLILGKHAIIDHIKGHFGVE